MFLPAHLSHSDQRHLQLELIQRMSQNFLVLLLVEDTVYDELVTVWDLLYAVFLWAILIYIIESIVRKFDWVQPIIKGKPSIIINDGELDLKLLKKNKLDFEQIRTMLRQQGFFSIKEVKYAVLEPSGRKHLDL